eukprot:4292271-Pleurochrysis_carterae.AAC.4
MVTPVSQSMGSNRVPPRIQCQVSAHGACVGAAPWPDEDPEPREESRRAHDKEPAHSLWVVRLANIEQVWRRAQRLRPRATSDVGVGPAIDDEAELGRLGGNELVPHELQKARAQPDELRGGELAQQHGGLGAGGAQHEERVTLGVSTVAAEAGCGERRVVVRRQRLVQDAVDAVLLAPAERLADHRLGARHVERAAAKVAKKLAVVERRHSLLTKEEERSREGAIKGVIPDECDDATSWWAAFRSWGRGSKRNFTRGTKARVTTAGARNVLNSTSA